MMFGRFASLGNERVAMSFDETHATVVGDVASAQSFVTYRNLAADGTPGRSMQNRMSWMLLREKGRWSIAHEQASAPGDPARAR